MKLKNINFDNLLSYTVTHIGKLKHFFYINITHEH
jgi:hypothetical protein